MKNNFRSLGIEIPTILLPNKNINMKKWSVIACDQYTSQPEYWKTVEDTVKDSCSTLNMILPEVFLTDSNVPNKILDINNTMNKYLNDGTLVSMKNSFILIERTTLGTHSRKGLLLALDLEKYDFSPKSQSLIRATEGTVLDRLPPRIKIRKDAPLEIPHITILIDDPQKTVIEPLYENKNQYEKLYDFELMLDGGHVSGYKIDDENSYTKIYTAMKNLSDKETFKSKYNAEDDKGVLLFAVGDGNHSLATAKVCWENIKSTLSAEEQEEHPARFALVEVVNLHDEGLIFEPIHRIVMNIDETEILKSLSEYFNTNIVLYKNKKDMKSAAATFEHNNKANVVSFVTQKGYGTIVCNNSQRTLDVACLESFLEYYSKKNPALVTDYIHDEKIVDSLGSQKDSIGFYLSPIDKNDFFKSIIERGLLPKKTFSLGLANEKKYYVECRKISVDF